MSKSKEEYPDGGVHFERTGPSLGGVQREVYSAK